MEAYYLGSKQDERGLVGPRLLRNLRGEATRLCEELAVQETVGEGYSKILQTLQAVSTESTLRSIPRLYDCAVGEEESETTDMLDILACPSMR